MTIGQLKKSLERFGPNLDDAEVVLAMAVDGKERFDQTAFVAYSEVPEVEGIVCIIGTMSSAIERMKKGTLKYPDGHKPATEGIDLSSPTNSSDELPI